jgi:preprotein translocase subunit SecG
MSTLFTILAVLALVGSILITLVVLLQNSKGGGLASNFTAGNQTFGVRQTTDILEKITWGLAIFVLVVSISASFFSKSDLSNLADRAGEDIEAVENTAENSDVDFTESQDVDVEAPSEAAAN